MNSKRSKLKESIINGTICFCLTLILPLGVEGKKGEASSNYTWFSDNDNSTYTCYFLDSK